MPNCGGSERSSLLLQMKTCPKCGINKSISKFYLNKGKRDGHANYCKVCQELCCRRWRKNNPEKSCRIRRNSRLKWVYGISANGFDVLKKKQKNRCAICGVKPNKLCIDHNHVTGKVRGLLCRDCNLILGHCDDSPIVLDSAKKYLIRHNKK